MRRTVSAPAAFLAVLPLNACVVGAENHASRQDVATSLPPTPAERSTAIALVTERTHPAAQQTAPPAASGEVRTAGYHHWNGVRYEWVPPSPETRSPEFRWR